MKKLEEFKYYIAIGIIIAIYLIIKQVTHDESELNDFVNTISILIAAVAFWLQFKRTKNIEEATFIMELNHQFISNDDLTKIEHALEMYYNQIRKGENKPELNLELEIESRERQNLINYLVYMEGLAALIQKGVMQIGVIDDLFAYRFFIAVNNPVVQKTELLPYSNYYQGCFKLSEMWTKKFNKDNREIPLEEYSLYKCKNN